MKDLPSSLVDAWEQRALVDHLCPGRGRSHASVPVWIRFLASTRSERVRLTVALNGCSSARLQTMTAPRGAKVVHVHVPYDKNAAFDAPRTWVGMTRQHRSAIVSASPIRSRTELEPDQGGWSQCIVCICRYLTKLLLKCVVEYEVKQEKKKFWHVWLALANVTWPPSRSIKHKRSHCAHWYMSSPGHLATPVRHSQTTDRVMRRLLRPLTSTPPSKGTSLLPLHPSAGGATPKRS